MRGIVCGAKSARKTERPYNDPGMKPLPQRADLVVIGGGIVGAASAFFLSRAGVEVLLLERLPALARLTTPRSLEAFRAQFEDADDIRMMLESIGVFERFAEVVGLPGWDISLHQQGYLFATLAPDGPRRIETRVAAQRAAGLEDVVALSGAEARRLFPYLAPEVSAAAFRARDGWLASHELTYGFAKASGAMILLETEVTGFELAKGRLEAVATNRGRVATRRAVIAAGPYSGRLAERADVSLPLTAVRRQRAGIRSHPLIPREAPMTISLDDGAHWRPEPPGAYLAWSGALQESPREPCDDVPVDPDYPAIVIDAVAALSPFWRRVTESLTRANVTLEAGLYDLTPDARPIIGPSPIEGLFLHCGYSGHGIMGSAGGARLLSDIVVGRERPETNPYRLARFDDLRSRRPAKAPL